MPSKSTNAEHWAKPLCQVAPVPRNVRGPKRRVGDLTRKPPKKQTS